MYFLFLLGTIIVSAPVDTMQSSAQNWHVDWNIEKDHNLFPPEAQDTSHSIVPLPRLAVIAPIFGNAKLDIIPKSHRRPDKKVMMDTKYHQVHFEPGDILLMTGDTIHRGSAYSTDEVSIRLFSYATSSATDWPQGQAGYNFL